MKSILQKLNKIQTELKAPKCQFNAFGKYKYRSCEDIMESVKPSLKELGCALTISDSIQMIGERYYVMATAQLYDTDSGESIMVYGYAREEESKKGMDGSQVTGASSSYARKYALNGLFAIDDTKDSDSTNTHGKDDAKTDEPTPQEINKIETEKVNKTHIASLSKEMDRTGVKEKQILSMYENLSCIEEMTFRQWTEVMRKLQVTKTAKKQLDL